MNFNKSIITLFFVLIWLPSFAQPGNKDITPSDLTYLKAYTYHQQKNCTQAQEYYELFMNAYQGKDREYWIRQAGINKNACPAPYRTEERPAMQVSNKYAEQSIAYLAQSTKSSSAKNEKEYSLPSTANDPKRTFENAPALAKANNTVTPPPIGTSDRGTFQVQFFVSKYDNKTFPSLKGIGTVQQKKVPGENLYAYYMPVGSQEQAEQLRIQIESKGFSNPIISPMESDRQAGNVTTLSPSQVPKPTPPAKTKIDLQNAYLVQFVTLSHKNAPYSELDGFGKTIFEKVKGRELYGYYKGPYATKEEANRALERIRAAGREKAFIVMLKDKPSIIKDLEGVY